MEDGYIWGDAEVTYPDWIGTAQLDERMTGRSINEIVGLDEEWHVIGLDLGGGEHQHDLHVIAVHGSSVPPGGAVLPKIAASNNGEIPATDFLVHDRDPYEVLREISHIFELRMRVSGAEGLPIRIMSRSDIPEQPIL